MRLAGRHGLWTLLLVLTALRAVFAATVELSPDEAYYWTWSQSLAFGYYDHPPLIAWIIRLTTGLLGDTALGVRLGALIFGAATPWLVFVLCRRLLGREDWSFWLALCAAATPILSVGAVVHTPDAALAFFWALAAWFALRAFEGDRLSDWVGLGVSVALAALAKSTGLLLIPAVGLYAVGCKAGRGRLRGVGPAIGLIAALICLAPQLIWNADHRGGSLAFQLAHATKGLALRPFGLFEFLGGQLGVVSPLLWIGAAGFMAVGFSRQVRFGRPEAFMLWCLSAPLVLFCALLSIVHRVEANWPAVAYLTAVPGLAWAWTGGRWYLKRRRLWLGLTLGLALIMTLLIHLQTLLPFLPLPPGRDPTARLRGWSAWSSQVCADADALHATVAAEGYGPVSLLRFYGQRPVTYERSDTRASQYDLWPPVRPGRRVLFLQPKTSDRPPDLCRRARERWQLIRDGGFPARAAAFRWIVCEGLPGPEGDDHEQP